MVNAFNWKYLQVWHCNWPQCNCNELQAFQINI